MMDVGFWELVLLGAIVLMVAGPERLPTIARTVGRWVGQAKAMSRNLKGQFERELHDMENRQQRETNNKKADEKPDNETNKHGQ